MSLAVLDARQTDRGLAVTFITEGGLEPLEGSGEEIMRLAAVMRQVSVLAAAGETERVWIEDVPVGEAIVRLGLGPDGQARVRIVRM